VSDPSGRNGGNAKAGLRTGKDKKDEEFLRKLHKLGLDRVLIGKRFEGMKA
jgi:hypothetical protein